MRMCSVGPKRPASTTVTTCDSTLSSAVTCTDATTPWLICSAMEPLVAMAVNSGTARVSVAGAAWPASGAMVMPTSTAAGSRLRKKVVLSMA